MFIAVVTAMLMPIPSIVRAKYSFFFSAIFFSPPPKKKHTHTHTHNLSHLMDMVDMDMVYIFKSRTFQEGPSWPNLV